MNVRLRCGAPMVSFYQRPRRCAPCMRWRQVGLHQFVPKLAQAIRSWQPSHIVAAFADVGVFGYLAIKQSGHKPYWVHGVHATHDAVTATPSIKGRLRYQLDQYFAAWVYKKAGKVVAVSDGVRADVLQRFTVDASQVVTIYNPVLDRIAGSYPKAPLLVFPHLQKLWRWVAFQHGKKALIF